MPGQANTSFIPKHTPNKPDRKNSPRQFFIGTLLVRVLFFAVIIATIVLFFYQQRLTNQLRAEVAMFEDAARAYETDADKLELVTSTDLRLAQAKQLLESSFSVYALFSAIENATINTAQLTALDLSYLSAEEIKVSASIATESFDSALFQRSVFLSKPVLASAGVQDIEIKADDNGFIDANRPLISFVASIMVNPESIKTVVVPDSAFIPPQTQGGVDVLAAPSPVVEEIVQPSNE